MEGQGLQLGNRERLRYLPSQNFKQFCHSIVLLSLVNEPVERRLMSLGCKWHICISRYKLVRSNLRYNASFMLHFHIFGSTSHIMYTNNIALVVLSTCRLLW